MYLMWVTVSDETKTTPTLWHIIDKKVIAWLVIAKGHTTEVRAVTIACKRGNFSLVLKEVGQQFEGGQGLLLQEKPRDEPINRPLLNIVLEPI